MIAASTLRDRNATTVDKSATVETADAVGRDVSASSVEVPALGQLRPMAAIARADHHGSTLVRREPLRRWIATIATCDAAAAAVAASAVLVARGGFTADHQFAVAVAPLVAAFVPVWLAALAVAGGYDARHIVAGFEQYRSVVRSGVWVLASVALLSLESHADLSRAFVLGSVPTATLLTVTGRYGVRKALQRRLRGNRALHRVLAVGEARDVWQLVAHMARASYAGFRVVGAVTPLDVTPPPLPPSVSWVGADADDVLTAARRVNADTIAVLGTHVLPQGQLRRLSWDLEGTDIDLVMAPAITDVAGPRISTHPVAGLPLLCVNRPRFAGPCRGIKEALDRSLSALGLLLLSPALIVIALVIKLSSSGPVFFVQERVGLNGRRFPLLKFRSMREGAHDERRELECANEHDGPLFKIRRDPRVTSLGAFLRRWSLDELPQLWNVLRGDMSLVGPRPPLPGEVERYGTDVRRRLLVKPGITGLWQVSGRAELSWDESVRLDLYYIDNWSVGYDLALLGKTVACVLRGQGAY